MMMVLVAHDQLCIFYSKLFLPINLSLYGFGTRMIMWLQFAQVLMNHYRELADSSHCWHKIVLREGVFIMLLMVVFLLSFVSE